MVWDWLKVRGVPQRLVGSRSTTGVQSHVLTCFFRWSNSWLFLGGGCIKSGDGLPVGTSSVTNLVVFCGGLPPFRQCVCGGGGGAESEWFAPC